jgi:hypothetical protein
MKNIINLFRMHFIILYTHQLQKVKKKWFDGQMHILKGGKKAAIFDETGDRIYSFFLKKIDRLIVGNEIKTGNDII